MTERRATWLEKHTPQTTSEKNKWVLQTKKMKTTITSDEGIVKWGAATSFENAEYVIKASVFKVSRLKYELIRKPITK